MWKLPCSDSFCSQTICHPGLGRCFSQCTIENILKVGHSLFVCFARSGQPEASNVSPSPLSGSVSACLYAMKCKIDRWQGHSDGTGLLCPNLSFFESPKGALSRAFSLVKDTDKRVYSYICKYHHIHSFLGSVIRTLLSNFRGEKSTHLCKVTTPHPL